MVSYLATWIIAATGPLVPVLGAAEEKAKPLLMRLDPQNRAKVLMALLGLALVGVGLVALTIMAGRQVLRIARTSHGPTRRHEDDWSRKPLVPKEPESPTARDPE
ncbi:MAG: hypothetical protein WD063_00695 [Pirellulales bacterium]